MLRWIPMSVVLGFCSCLLQVEAVTTVQYDSQHRLTKVTYGEGTIIRYTYDASGNRLSRLAYVPVPADFNGDGFVDESDFAAFDPCFSGPGVPYDSGSQPTCGMSPDSEGQIAADFDKDNDVDQDDFGVFQRCWSGTEEIAHPDCAD